MTKKIILLLPLFALMGLQAGCGRQYSKGKYIPADEIILRSDKFVEADLQAIADHLSGSLLKEEDLLNKKPTVLMSIMTNSTDEHIDMKSLSDKIRTELFKSKKLRFINETLRPTAKEELDYEAGEYVDPASAKKKGRQLGADYLISGNIVSIKQPVGRQEIVYYKMTLEMTDLNTNIIAWTDEMEVKKRFYKRFTGN
ncbi:MAG: penicillin-binding protein activator LpoB [Deltaproteobacteria bacterium]|nr:MAG: penicillin-binding protein activator LpoB [Deltaproteobacteria bacterium]